jgi:hypothetical protein
MLAEWAAIYILVVHLSVVARLAFHLCRLVILVAFSFIQCCGSGSAWIRIIFRNLDQDPHPHQIKIRIWICIKEISWIQIRIRINLQMTSQNVRNMSLFKCLFKSQGRR